MTLLVQGTFVYTIGDIEERIDRFHREVTEKVAEYFEKVFSGTIPVEKPYPINPKLAIKDSVFAHEEISWLNNVYFVRGRNILNSRKDSHKKFLSTIVLLSILNRMVREELRDKTGLTYSADYSYTPFPMEDYFGFGTSCSPEKIPRIIDFIKHIEEDIRINVPLDEFQISRKKRIRSIQDEYSFGTHFIKVHTDNKLGLMGTYDEQIATLEGLTPDDIIKAANDIFSKPFVQLTFGRKTN